MSAISAAASRNVVSSTVGHLLIYNGGTYFKISHGFGNLLDEQLEATLEGRPNGICIHVHHVDGLPVYWPNSSIKDYIYRAQTKTFEELCAYYMCMHYNNMYMSERDLAQARSKSPKAAL